MSKRIFNRIPEFGIVEYWHYDEGTDKATIETVQDERAVADANKRIFNSVDERAPYRDGMQHVARIPLSVYLDLRQRGILRDQKKMKAWLNDRDNQAFRTRPGRV